MTIQKIKAVNEATLHPNITKKVSISNLLISLLILIAGIAAIVASFRLNDSKSSLNMALMVAGSIFVLWGAFRLLWRSQQTVYIPTGSKVKEETLFFDLRHLDKLKELCTSDMLPSDADLKSANNGNIRLDVITSSDRKFAAVQLFQFVPYTFNPVTSLRYYTDEKASQIHEFLNNCSKR